MSRLRSQIDILKGEYSISRSSGNNKNNIEGCNSLYERFDPVYEKIKLLSKNVVAVRSLPGDDSNLILFSDELINKLIKTISTLKVFILEWGNKKSDILQENIVDDNSVALVDLEKEYSSKIKELWVEWIEALESSFNIDESMLETQRDMPNFSDTYYRYISLRKEFKDKSREIPDNVFKVEKIEEIASGLKALLEQMEFDIPPDLAEFFKHINNNKGQAPLSLLTPSVLDWLKEHDQLGGFTIHRKLY